jgi:hypothetical protein
MISANEFHGYYVGRQVGNTDRLGYVRSTDGITWTKDSRNPVLSDATDDDLGDEIDLLLDNDKLRLYYGQYDLVGDTLRGKGYAEADIMQDPGAPTLLDNFNRAGPTLGANWTDGSKDTTTGGIIIIGSVEVAHPVVGSYRMGAYYNARQFGPDLQVVAEVSAPPADEFEGYTLFTRFQLPTASELGWGFYITKNASGGAIWNINNSADSLSNDDATALATGTFIGVTMQGPTGRLWRKITAASPWELMVEVTSPTAVNKAGYFAWDFTLDNVARLTNLWIQTLEIPVSQIVTPRGFGPF